MRLHWSSSNRLLEILSTRVCLSVLRYTQLTWEGYRRVLKPSREFAHNRRQMMNMPAPYNAHVSFANSSLKLGMIALTLSKSNLAWAPWEGRATTDEVQWKIKKKLERVIQRQMREINSHYLETAESSFGVLCRVPSGAKRVAPFSKIIRFLGLTALASVHKSAVGYIHRKVWWIWKMKGLHPQVKSLSDGDRMHSGLCTKTLFRNLCNVTRLQDPFPSQLQQKEQKLIEVWGGVGTPTSCSTAFEPFKQNSPNPIFIRILLTRTDASNRNWLHWEGIGYRSYVKTSGQRIDSLLAHSAKILSARHDKFRSL